MELSGGGLFVVGLNHRSAPVEVREALAFPGEALADELARVRTAAGLAEALILSTCNRVEVYGVGDQGAVEAAVAFLLDHGRRGHEEARLFYRLEGEEAVRHAFRVAAGLDSLVVGEPEILGQVKQAYDVAAGAGTLGALLSALRHRTSSVAKRVRTRTGVGRHAVSVPHVGVELARKIFGHLRERRVLLVGAGRMCRLAARRLAKEGAHLVVAGRTLSRAAELAVPLGGSAVPVSALREELGRADIVLTGTGAAGVVIAREDVQEARQARGGRPLFIVDIAVPRDVDPAVRGLDGVFLYDLDDLKAVAEANLRERGREAAAAESLVAQEARDFMAARQCREAVPLLVELRRRGDDIRRQEVEKVRQRLGPLTPKQEQALETLTAAIVNKLLHAPTVTLKEMAREGRVEERAPLVRAVFGLT